MPANFYEKALFVKADVAALEIVAECNSCVPFALCFYPHSLLLSPLFLWLGA